MFCMKCGQQLPDEAQFCFRCGTKVTVLPPSPPPSVNRDHAVEVIRRPPVSGTGGEAAVQTASEQATPQDQFHPDHAATYPKEEISEDICLASASEYFRDYIDKLKKRLKADMEYSAFLGSFCYDDTRTSFQSVLNMTKNHHHFYIRYDNNITGQELNTFAENCLGEVLKLPHHASLGTGTFAVPFICMDKITEEIKNALSVMAMHRKTTFSYSCISYPAVLDLSAGTIHYPRTPFYGFAVVNSLKKTIGDTLFYRR